MAKIPDRKNMTTSDILAHCRAEVSSGSPAKPAAEEADPTPAADDAAAESAAEEAAPAAESKPAAPAKKPTSTKDILAAARASAGGGGGKPAAAPKSDKPKAKPAAAPGAKPSSTKDILAAARAAAAGGGAAPKADKASPAAPAKTKAAPAAGGEKPSVKEMLAAFRKDKQATEEAPAARTVDGKQLPPKLPVPPRSPKVKPAPAPVDEHRRSFLASLMVMPSAFASAWALIISSSVAWTLALVRFGLPNVLVEPPSKFKIGSPGDYDFGTVSTKWKAERGIWVVHTDRYKGKNVIVALSTVCTHLGCTPNWLEGEQKFKCPCHGSGFYIDGINFEGPAPRPLERHGISVAADGMLEVDKSLKFQEEMGQWEDPKSFVTA